MTIFDARSARMGRITGWERYTTELAKRFLPRDDIEVWSWPVEPPPIRILSDIRASTLSRNSAVHFPTFPPLAPKRVGNFFLTVHDLTWWKYPEMASKAGLHYYRPLLERAVPLATRITTHSIAVADEVAEYFDYPRDDIFPIHCGSGLLDGRKLPIPELMAGWPYLLAVGSLEPRKNLDRLVAGFAASDASRHMRLVVVGRRAWGDLPAGVMWLPNVGDEALAALYGHASAVVSASLYEGFGLPLAEAINMGVPIVCSDIPVFREVAGESATYFDPLDISSICAAIDSVQPANPAVRQETDVPFSWDRTAQAVAAMYQCG